MTNKSWGIAVGYEADLNELPRCPYPLWENKDGKNVRPVERDEWLEGFHIGRRLKRKHTAELAAEKGE